MTLLKKKYTHTQLHIAWFTAKDTQYHIHLIERVLLIRTYPKKKKKSTLNKGNINNKNNNCEDITVTLTSMIATD